MKKPSIQLPSPQELFTELTATIIGTIVAAGVIVLLESLVSAIVTSI